MGRALHDFAWGLRFHPEVAVRRGVLIALSAIGEGLPPAVLVQELHDALAPLQEWLRAAALEESDLGCQQLAIACHALFGDKVRRELQHGADDDDARMAGGGGALTFVGAIPGGVRFM
uniref:Uncharacterized protein n=1 Tax=Prymnesium polylepis TaxID=72548 RepID=A0A7S4NLP9_9EUKA